MSHMIHYIVAPAAIIAAGGAIPCYAATYMTVEQAQKVCFPGATEFAPADVHLTPGQIKAIEKDSGVRVRLDRQKVWRAQAGNKFIGWFIQDEVLGKHEFISWVLAIDAGANVKQIEILDYRETYGYEIRDDKWRGQFYGKQHGAKLKIG